MECTHCGSSKYIKNGVYKCSQRYRCKECNRYFSDKLRKFTYADKRKALVYTFVLFLGTLLGLIPAMKNENDGHYNKPKSLIMHPSNHLYLHTKNP
ncbi:MAG: hypothetical protein FWG85_07680, partial [Bacteroidetes bacterium]|nr:hypothetical protein [Bacteroidota bacterium]